MVDNKRTIKFEIKVDADAKGADRIARALKELEGSAPIADRELKKVRQGILDFVQATGTSERSIKAAEAALRGLQGEAKAGGPLWRQLGKDIAGYKQQLGELNGTIKTTAQLQREAAQAAREFDKAFNLNLSSATTFTKIAQATAVLNKELEQTNFRSEKYARTLARIKELETVSSFNRGRLNVIASNQAFTSGTVARGYGSSERLPALPDTLAADSLLVSELTQRIQNLDRGSELYLQTVRELTVAQKQLAAAQEQLNRAVGDATRGTALQNARAGLGDLNADFSLRDRARAQRERRGALVAGAAAQARADGIAEWQQAARDRVAQIREDNDLRARAEAERRRAREAAERRRAQRAAEEAEGQRRLTLERENRRRDRRRQLADVGATATAVGVGGFFGGVEGGVGAALGGALAGPGGAQAGATIGLGVSSARMAIGNMATQAADLNKLRLSLRAVVGSQGEYAAALQTIATANRELNVPLVDGTRSFTQLAAAVKGAGGTVADAAVAYNGIASAIKATGGSAQDADGAIRAIVQTFSKGKVSAEEIRGQLAERLPGAVTLFAASIGKTGPELDKMFEKGEVGLNDLMKFLGTLNTRYSATARQLAASNDEAGLRMQLRWEQTTLAIGKAFQPLGAQIQNETAKALTDSIPTIERWAEAFAGSIKRVSGLLESLSGSVGSFSSVLDRIPRSIQIAFRASGPGWLLNAVGLLPGFQLSQAQSAWARGETNSQFKPGEYIKGLGGSAAPVSAFEGQLSRVQDNIKRLRAEIKGLEENSFRGPGGEAVLSATRKTLENEYVKSRQLISQIKQLQGRPGGKGPTDFPNLTGKDSDDSARKKADAEAERQQRIAEQLAAERQRLAEANAQQEIRLAEAVNRAKIELDNERYANQRKLRDAQAQAELAYLSPARREAMGAGLDFQRLRDEGSDRVRELRQRVTELEQGLAGARRMAAVTALAPQAGSIAPPAVMTGGRSSGLIARTGSTGDSTGPHLDARWADRRPITAADADRYLRVNGRAPSSFGVTSGYGPRNLFGRSFHAGIDFGTPSGSGITLQNGAKLLRDLGFTGAGGYAVEIDTPQGRMRLLHLQRGSASAPSAASSSTGSLRRTPAGVAAQERRGVADDGDVAVMEQQLTAARALLQEAEKSNRELYSPQAIAFIGQRTQALRDNTSSIRENIQQLQDRTRFTMEGYGQLEIDALVEINRVQREGNEVLESYVALRERAARNGDLAAVQTWSDLIRQQTQYLQENADAMRDQARAQREAQEAMGRGFGFREGARQYVDSIGTMREATAQLTNTGIKGAEEALFSLATTGTANFREFAASILRDTTRMIIQQLILKTIMQAIGAIGGGISSGGFSVGGVPDLPGLSGAGALGFASGGAFGSNGIIPFASGGVVQRPTLFKFANGGAMSTGLMGEAGPEAIMPLKRGPDGKLGVSGGGGVNVTVNVSMGGGGESMQADSAQGAQLGRAVSVAVQQELIKQKRPGGLLA